MRLVLDAARIPSQLAARDGLWFLAVTDEDHARAKAELDAYLEENAETANDRSDEIPRHPAALLAIAVYSLVLSYVMFLATRRTFGMDWLETGAVQAGRVTSGQWWRCFTGLTLHLDGGHLIANLLFGAIFGLLAGRILGGGVAWLIIVLAGGLGNAANAMIQPPAHTSLGASTAVFSALGVIIAHAIGRGWTDRDSPMRRWSPLIGGLLLLVLTGTEGERTDVVSHLTGFLAGLFLGWPGCKLPDRWLSSSNVQFAAGFATILLLVIAWAIAIVSATHELAGG
jgi:membrane associated rhomboid family serine protease